WPWPRREPARAADARARSCPRRASPGSSRLPLLALARRVEQAEIERFLELSPRVLDPFRVLILIEEPRQGASERFRHVRAMFLRPTLDAPSGRAVHAHAERLGARHHAAVRCGTTSRFVPRVGRKC